jgi:hypothetical protein
MDCQETGLQYWAASDVNEKELQSLSSFSNNKLCPIKFDQALDLSIGC